jgi:hypothetical protein
VPSSLRTIAVAFTSLTAIGATAVEDPALPGVRSFTVPLTGAAESNVGRLVGTAGDPDGYGTVRLSIDLRTKQVCYDFSLARLSTPLMAHIHRAPPDRIGPSVVTLFTGMRSDELVRCIPWTNKRLAEIVAQPSNFYVNVYTTEFPDGAVRGQLASAGPISS